MCSATTWPAPCALYAELGCILDPSLADALACRARRGLRRAARSPDPGDRPAAAPARARHRPEHLDLLAAEAMKQERLLVNNPCPIIEADARRLYEAALVTARRCGRETPIATGATIATRWADNDAYGHVNNTIYYAWFDTAVNAWLIEAGLLDVAGGRSDRPRRRDRLPLRRAARISASGRDRPGRRAAWHDRASPIGSASSRRASRVAAAEGHFTHVYVDRTSRAPAALPASWRAKLEKIQSGG